MRLPKDLEALVLDYFWSRVHYAETIRLNQELEILYILAEAKCAYSYCLFETQQHQQQEPNNSATNLLIQGIQLQ